MAMIMIGSAAPAVSRQVAGVDQTESDRTRDHGRDPDHPGVPPQWVGRRRRGWGLALGQQRNGGAVIDGWPT